MEEITVFMATARALRSRSIFFACACRWMRVRRLAHWMAALLLQAFVLSSAFATVAGQNVWVYLYWTTIDGNSSLVKSGEYTNLNALCADAAQFLAPKYAPAVVVGSSVVNGLMECNVQLKQPDGSAAHFYVDFRATQPRARARCP
jgi:hypothetical protein